MKKPLLVTDPYNIRYLTGFEGSYGFLLVAKENILFTDARYIEYAHTLTKKKSKIEWSAELVDSNLKEMWQKTLKKMRISKIYVEAHHMTLNTKARFESLSGEKITLIPHQNEIAFLREIKSSDEIEKIAKAQEIIEQVFYSVKSNLSLGKSEKEIAWEVEKAIKECGGEGISFDPIIAFDENTAVPHHHPTDKKLKKGDPILFDIGAKFDGYCSDMTRMVFTTKPTDKQTLIYNAVLEAQQKATEGIKAGVKGKTPDTIARKSLTKQGFEKYFTHSLGHGVGLEVHDPSIGLSTKCTRILKENMVVTIEPGVYMEGEFGVRIEDMGVVTKSGITLLTKAPKKIEECIVSL